MMGKLRKKIPIFLEYLWSHKREEKEVGEKVRRQEKGKLLRE